MSQKKDDRKKKKKKGFKAGLIAAGATALLYAQMFPLYRIGDFLLCFGLSMLAGKLISVMAEGLDLTTHNKQDQPRQAPEELPLSGNEVADAVIAKGQEMLRQIRAENDAIPDQLLSAQMDELERRCVQIFHTVAEKPHKAPQIRKFMNYYLPTTLKMLGNYRTMQDRGVSVSEITAARDTLTRGMNMVLTACQKQLDNLYKETMLDVSTDIDVLEQMLMRDGYAEGELVESARGTAAAAQMQQGAPILEAPAAEGDDFVSFYSNRADKQK